jgi:hypothetical protein
MELFEHRKSRWQLREIGVMFESDNTLFVTVYGNAHSLGDLTATDAITKTFAGGGVAIGFAGATAVAEGTTAAAPIHGRDDRLACGRRIYNQFAHQRSLDRLFL